MDVDTVLRDRLLPRASLRKRPRYCRTARNNKRPLTLKNTSIKPTINVLSPLLLPAFLKAAVEAEKQEAMDRKLKCQAEMEKLLASHKDLIARRAVRIAEEHAVSKKHSSCVTYGMSECGWVRALDAEIFYRVSFPPIPTESNSGFGFSNCPFYQQSA